MLDRLGGTIAGACCGVAVALALPRSGPVATGLALSVGLLPVAVLTAFKPAYRVAPVTVVIVVLAYAGQQRALDSALLRTAEIMLGSIVAFVVALTVLPSRARNLLLLAARDALAPIGEQIALLLGDLSAAADAGQVQALHDRIRAALSRAEANAQEAARERASRVSEAPDPEPLVRALRRLWHDLVMVARLRTAPLPDPVAARLAPAAAALAAAAGAFLAAAGAALAGGNAPPEPKGVADAIEGYRAATTTLRAEGMLRLLPGDAVEQVYGIGFALEQFGRNLAEFQSRAAEFA
jgi:uncharacterized membrane protein YccC